MSITFTCETCGTEVTRRRSPSTLRGKAPRYCSQRCHGVARRGTGDGQRVTHEFDCAVCGKRCRVYRSPSATAPVTCSLKCTGARNTGAGNAAYSGGRHVAGTGYVRVLNPAHPQADSRGYVYEHRLAMEAKIGRPLRPGEVVHHINHVKHDNRPENLHLFASQADHMAHHAQETSA